MTLIELKKSIHKKVDDLNDRKLLKLVDAIVNRNDKAFIIPEYMKEGIRQGVEDIKNGDFITIEAFEKKYEQWLKN